MLPDIIKRNLALLICGYNPGRDSCASGHYFANPRHRFWDTLHSTGFTGDEILASSRDAELLRYGIGLTDLLKNTRHGDEIKVSSADRERLTRLVLDYQPKIIAFLGKRPASEYMRIPRRRLPWGLSSNHIEGTQTVIAVMPDPSPRSRIFEELKIYWRDLSRKCETK